MAHDEQALLEKLAPEAIRRGLVRAGIFLAGWELLKAQIQDQVKSFYSIGFDADGLTYSKDYRAHVLARHSSVFASQPPRRRPDPGW